MNARLKCVSVLVAAMLVAGCSVGIKDDGQGALKTSFKAPVNYQEAYRRADTYARHCRTSNSMWKGSFNVDGDVFTDTKKGVVRINMPNAGRDLERIEIEDSMGQSNVSVTAWGVGLWDDREIAAAKASIMTGVPVCRKDMPS
jgi:hypothetical protein